MGPTTRQARMVPSRPCVAAAAVPRTTRRFRRRAASYVFFLSAAMLVTIIGISSLTVVRLKLRAADGGYHGATARLYAQSAIEAATLAIYADTNWRDTISHDTWRTTQSIGDGSFTWKLADEINSSLTADRSASTRVYGRGVCGDSVWVYSVLVQPPLESLPSNMLVNGDLETGAPSPWTGQGGAQIEARTDAPHDGKAYAYVKNRSDLDAIPTQTLSGSLVSGTTYRAECWVKLNDQADGVWLGLLINTDTEWEYFEFTEADAETSWTHLSGEVTPVWSGTATAAVFQMGTAIIDQEFMFDDVVLLKVPGPLGPVPGTWRREPL